MEEVICMLILFLINVGTLTISISIFADIDNIKYKPEKGFQVSEKINKFFMLELFTNFLTAFSSFLYGSLIVFGISFVLTFYNLKKFITKEYKLYFSIGDENKTICENFSFRYKIKFIGYLLIVTFSLSFVLIFLLLKGLEKILNDKDIPKYFLRLISYI